MKAVEISSRNIMRKRNVYNKQHEFIHPRFFPWPVFGCQHLFAYVDQPPVIGGLALRK